MKRAQIFGLFCFAFIYLGNSSGICPKSRRAWGARAPDNVDYQTIPVKYVIIHNTMGSVCYTFSDCSTLVRNIQFYHMETLHWSDIGYNFLIGNDGNIYEGRGWHRAGAHTYGYNNKSIGIAFIGNFQDQLPTDEALAAVKKLLNLGVELGELDRRYRLLGARQVSNTLSPGLALFNEIQQWDQWVARP